MKIDLHVHSRERSACSRASLAEMVAAAIAVGLDGIAVTDHERLVPAEELAELNRRHAPFRIFRGIERHIPEDVVVLGVDDPELETANDYGQLVGLARRHGGYVILAHPYRYGDAVAMPVDEFPPDAVELHSLNTGAEDEPRILALAGRLGARAIVASDAHDTANVGAYHLELARRVGTDAELVAELRRGAFSFGSRPGRIAELNADTARREDGIRAMIRQGIPREEFARLTGQWEGLYDRVAMGKSYRI